MKKIFRVLAVVAILVLTVCFAFGCTPTTSNNKKGLLLKKFGTDDYYTVYGYVDEGKDITTLDIDAMAKEIDEDIVVGRIKKNAFNGNTTLKEIIVPTTVEVMDEGAFAGIRNLEKLTIPFVGGAKNADCYLNETASSEDKAVDLKRTFGYLFGTSEFAGGAKILQSYNAKSTAEVYIPTSLKEVVVKPVGEYKIPMYAFAGNTVVEKVVLDGNFTAIGEYAFSGATNLRNITIPATVTTLYKGAFANCANLKDQGFAIASGSQLATIGESAFEGVGLNNLVIPQAVASVGARAFKNSKLVSVLLPTSVETIGAYAFYGCTYLANINCEISAKPNGWNAQWNNNCQATINWAYTAQ